MTDSNEQPADTTSADDWASGITLAINEHRAHARSVFRQQQERFSRLQAKIATSEPDPAAAGSADRRMDVPDPTALVTRFTTELDRLQTLLTRAEADSKPERRSDPDPPDASYDDLRRRFEMAVEDVRELKARNAELEEQLAQGSRGPQPATDRPTTTGLDWEAEKRRLVAQLEEFDDDDEQDRQDRLSIDGAIRITDQVVAEKEKQIAELTARLAKGAPPEDDRRAVTELLDKDEAIRRERDKLKNLQEDWQTKLRKAEIEISVERAKLARERSTMEEQIRTYERRLAETAADRDSAPDSHGGKKPNQRKWLSRLGLADEG